MLSSSILRKNKEVLTRNGTRSKHRSWTWHPLFIIFEASLGNPFVSHSICYKVIPCVVFDSMLPNHWSCRSYVQEKSIWNLYWVCHLDLSILSVSAFPVSSPIATCSFSLSNSVTHFVSLMGDTSRPSCVEYFSCSCRLHLIIQEKKLEII